MTAVLKAEQLEAALSATGGVVRGKAGPAAYSIGVDVVESPVLARLLDKLGERLAGRLYTRAEERFCDGDADRRASTLAGKEAVAKALGTGIRGGVRWTDIEILRSQTGAPYARLHGRAADRAAELRLRDIAVSLGHEGNVAFAIAMGLREEVAS